MSHLDKDEHMTEAEEDALQIILLLHKDKIDQLKIISKELVKIAEELEHEDKKVHLMHSCVFMDKLLRHVDSVCITQIPRSKKRHILPELKEELEIIIGALNKLNEKPNGCQDKLFSMKGIHHIEMSLLKEVKDFIDLVQSKFQAKFMGRSYER